MSVRFATVVAALLTLTTQAPAVEPDVDNVRRVNKAIEKGKQYLLGQGAVNGNWEQVVLANLGDQVGGQTALATLALLNSGVPVEDKVIQRAMDYLRKLEPQKTYVVGLTTMVFAEARQPKDLERIKINADWLIKNAAYQGGKLMGWGYPSGPGQADGSNTQYALLGLYAAKQAGIAIEDTQWDAIKTMYADLQKSESASSGFWQYSMSSGKDIAGQLGPSLTMTTAGVCGLLIAGMGLNESNQKHNEMTGIAANCGEYESNGKIAKGLNWIAARFSFDKAPGLKMSVLYNIYGIERLGRLSGQRWIGEHDWYREGCDWLIACQRPDGAWRRDDKFADRFEIIATSFSLLFLSKGRTPVLITKFAHGDAKTGEAGTLVERNGIEGIVGWNRKRNDARNLTEFASRELFNGLSLGWQVYDSRRLSFTPTELKEQVELLLASPVVYFNGHGRLFFNDQQKEILKKYIDEGGFLFAEACCGDEVFAADFRKLMAELFPDNKLEPMGPGHSVWRSFFNVSPADFPKAESLERGCKTVVVFTQTPVAGFLEEGRFAPKKGVPAQTQGQRAYQFAGNVIAYATGMQPPDYKGTRKVIVDPSRELSPPRGALKPAQLKLPDEVPPAPAAMRNLMGYIKASTNIDVVLDKQSIAPGDPELVKFKFMYLHGRNRMKLSDDEIENIKANLETGGLLFADAACGKQEFDESFREHAKKMFPEAKLEVVPLDDALYSKELNGVAVRSVKRREKTDGTGADGGYRDLPPYLEGIKLNGRWVVIYSKYDVGCALEKHKSTDCLGHTPESALQIGTAAVLYSLKR